MTDRHVGGTPFAAKATWRAVPAPAFAVNFIRHELQMTSPTSLEMARRAVDLCERNPHWGYDLDEVYREVLEASQRIRLEVADD